MPRPRSEKTQAALNDIVAGMTQSEAAKKHGVDQGLLSRMMKHKDWVISVKLTDSDLECLTDWLQYGELYEKLNDALLKLKDKKHEKERRIEK